MESTQRTRWAAKDQNSDEGRDSVASVVETLLAETFAAEQSLGQLTVAQVGEILMQTWESLPENRAENTDPQSIARRRSFEKCRDLFCEVLWQLEQQNRNEGLTETLEELRQRGEPTKLFRSQSKKQEVDPTFGALPDLNEIEPLRSVAPSEEIASSKAADLLPVDNHQEALNGLENRLSEDTVALPFGTAPLWDDKPAEKASPTAVSAEENELRAFDSAKIETPWQPTAASGMDVDLWGEGPVAASAPTPSPTRQSVSEEAPPTTWEEETPTQTNALAVTEETSNFEIAPSWEEPVKDQGVVPEAAEPDVTPLWEETLKSEANPDANSQWDLSSPGQDSEKSDLNQSPSLSWKETDSPVETFSADLEAEDVNEEEVEAIADKGNMAAAPLAKEYLQMAEHFAQMGHQDSFPFSVSHLDKITAQNYCFALEAEWLDKPSPALASFWSRRQPAILLLLDKNSGRFQFHPDLKENLVALSETHRDWLLEGKFPSAATLTSLRYFAGTSEISKLKLSLLDVAVLLLFFGQTRTVGQLSLTNEIGASGLAPKEMIELSFRLLRIQKIKSKCLSIAPDFTRNLLPLLETDIKRVFTLTHRLQFEPEETKSPILDFSDKV
jgi:hypothetical protein